MASKRSKLGQGILFTLLGIVVVLVAAVVGVLLWLTFRRMRLAWRP